ncbi:tyrosine-type recombinase/integrase [Kordia sp.]|uniref:tyrosine-type recombinase/integrase n=1 Tax=Kordia sp. TaxID=1965332 RepID=UPI003D2998B8
MKIQKSIEIYLKWKKSHRIIAHKRYKIRLDQFTEFLKITTNKSTLETINGDDIVNYHEAMETAGYSRATIAYSARILRNFFWFWHGRGHVSFSPKEIIPIAFVNADKDIIDREDFEILDALLTTKTLADIQKKLVINLLWDTGMRISELLDLKLSHISKQGTSGLRSAKVRTRKSMRYNQVVWSKETNAILNIYLGIRLSMETSHDELLINSKTKKPFTPRSVQRWMKTLLEEAQIDKNYTPHSFRHGKANEILEQGGTMRDVSVILRHVNPESSFAYTHLCVERHQKLAGKFINRTKIEEHTVPEQHPQQSIFKLDDSLIEAIKLKELLLQAS